MGEFKKGDVIRAKRDINGFFDKGANYRIAKRIGQNFVLTDNDEPEIEYAKHHTDLSWLIENFELATLKIEEGKFYKTRDGRKVGPMLFEEFGDGEPWHTSDTFRWWSNDGTRRDGSNGESDDLISEWIDEPVVAKVSNENAQPKFKVGDIVTPSHGWSKDSATVTQIKDGRVSVRWNNGAFGTENGWREDELSPVLPTPTTTIVALIENGQPKPSSTPHVHASTDAAEKEARRLAAKHKGQQFGVFTLTTTHHEQKPVYDHKWQNLAALGLKIDAIKELRTLAGIPQGHAERIVGQFAA